MEFSRVQTGNVQIFVSPLWSSTFRTIVRFTLNDLYRVNLYLYLLLCLYFCNKNLENCRGNILLLSRNFHMNIALYTFTYLHRLYLLYFAMRYIALIVCNKSCIIYEFFNLGRIHSSKNLNQCVLNCLI